MTTSIHDQLETLINAAQYDKFFGYGADAVAASEQALQAVMSFNPTFVPITVTYNPVGGPGTFVEPTIPTRSIGSLDTGSAPPDITIDTIVMEDPEGDDPDEPDAYVYRQPGNEPGALSVSRPTNPPSIRTVTMPDALSVTMPDAPTDADFYAIEIPEFAGMEVIEFEGERAVVDFDVPTENFAFTETAYSSALLTAVQARISTMLLGGTGLPAAIEQALFDRARSREDATALRAVQEVSEEFANRGWSEPPGMAAKRLREVRQNNQNQANTLSRDILIKATDVEIENLRFSVAQGIALEQVLIGAHLAVEQRRFEVARFAFEAVISIFNARVALHNAAVRGYEADAQVYRERVQAEIAKVQAFKAEVEAQAVLGEMNKTLAEVYESRVRGVRALIESYQAQIQAALAPLEISKVELEAHRLKVQVYAETVKAWATEWEGYNSRVRAELGNAEAAKISTDLFAAKVSARNTRWQAQFERTRASVAIEDLKIRKHRCRSTWASCRPSRRASAPTRLRCRLRHRCTRPPAKSPPHARPRMTAAGRWNCSAGRRRPNCCSKTARSTCRRRCSRRATSSRR